MADHKSNPTATSCSKDIEVVAANLAGEVDLRKSEHNALVQRFNDFEKFFNRECASIIEAAKVTQSTADKATAKQDAYDQYARAQANEWRGALGDISKAQASRSDLEGVKATLTATEKSLSATIAGVESRVALIDKTIAGTAAATKGISSYQGTLIAVGGLILAALVAFGGLGKGQQTVQPQIIYVPGSAPAQQSATTTTTVPGNVAPH